MKIKTLSEVSLEFKVPDITLRRAIHRCAFPAQKSAGTWLIDLEDTKFKDYLTTYRHKPRRTQKKATI